MFYKDLKPFIKQSSKKTFKRGQNIYLEGEQPESLFFIQQGLIGLYHISESGKETCLRIFSKDHIFGHRSYFASEPYHASAIALTQCEIHIISKEQCNDICENHPELLKKLTQVISKELGQAELRLAGLLDKSANKRIIESLIYLKHKYPEKIWTRKEVADFSGSTLETVTRVMTILDKESLISKDGRDFSINSDQDLLEFSKKF
jgi:CRP-like cAMP-binding protein